MIYIYIADVGRIDLSSLPPMSGYRKQKLEKIKNEQAKRLSAGLELVLYYALDKHHPEIALPPEIKKSPGGKPYINGVFFSLSDSKEYAACAISDAEVGLDIEKINPARNLDVGRKFLTERELRLLSADNFFDFWTKKESYMKLYGFENLPDAKDFDTESGYFRMFEMNGYKIAAASEKEDDAQIEFIVL